MASYIKITELEALMDVSETLSAMSGGFDEGVGIEARAAEKAINAILKRNQLQRVERKEQTEIKIGNIADSLS